MRDGSFVRADEDEGEAVVGGDEEDEEKNFAADAVVVEIQGDDDNDPDASVLGRTRTMG